MDKKGSREQGERIERLLAVEVDGMKAGIFGREWCEGCGEEGSFTGFCGAMAAHTSDGRFVCAGCRKSGLGTGWGGSSREELDRLIVERGFRYCGGCGREVALRQPTVGEARRRPLHCRFCRDRNWDGMARRRYLEHEATKEGGLDRAAARVAWAEAGIQRIVDNPEEE